MRGGKVPWKSTIRRADTNFWLGNFDNPVAAAKAVDNATYYLQPWSKNVPSYNFPDNWPSPGQMDREVEKPAEKTKNAMAKLKENMPDLAAELEKAKTQTPADRLEEVADRIAGNIISFAEQLRTELRVAAGQMRLLEATHSADKDEIARLHRTVKGLETMGGHQMFRQVAGQTVPATAVDKHLEA